MLHFQFLRRETSKQVTSLSATTVNRQRFEVSTIIKFISIRQHQLFVEFVYGMGKTENGYGFQLCAFLTRELAHAQ